MTQAAASAGVSVVYKPRDPAGLTRVLVGLLYVDVAITVLNAAGDAVYLAGLARYDPATPSSYGVALPGENKAVDLVLASIDFAQVVTFLVCGFVCLKWIYRVSLNAHALAEGLRTSPGWSVGWFFVPVANLWKPFQGLREAWQVSADPKGWKDEPTPELFRWWWGLWLASSILGNITPRLQVGATSVGGEMLAGGLNLINDLLGLPLDLVFLVIVRRLCALQISALSQREFD
jgi:hypothetical protein